MIYLLSFILSTLPAEASTHKAQVQVAGMGLATVHVTESEEDGVEAIVKLKGQADQDFDSLGEELIPIELGGKGTHIAVVDLDKDGTDEFLVRATEQPNLGMLYTFRWNPGKKKFEPVIFEGEEFISVDYGSPVKLSTKGALNFETSEFANEEGDKKTVAHSYQWKAGTFQVVK